MATPLGKPRRKLKFPSTGDMGSDGDATRSSSKVHNDNIIKPKSVEELSQELQAQLQAKIADLTNAFLGGVPKIGIIMLHNSRSQTLLIS
jgi:hypothetical protein